MIGFTFLVGLLPVVENLISNAAIVILSLSVSVAVAITSLVFLVVIQVTKNSVTIWHLPPAKRLLFSSLSENTGAAARVGRS